MAAKKRKGTKRVTVGGYYWTLGPLVLGSAKARALVQDQRDAATLTALKATRGVAKSVKLAGATALVFPGRAPAVWHALGERAGVLVRMASSQTAPHVKEALSLDPWAVPEKAWKNAVVRVALDGPANGARVLFDAVASYAGKPSASDKRTIDVTLPPGKYVVDKATHGERYLRVVLLRVRSADAIPTPPVGHVAAPPPTAPGALTLRPETAKLARTVKFVGTEGGPLLAIPTALLKSWFGVYDAKGQYAYETTKTDYDRACDLRREMVLKIGRGQGLVLEGPDSSALIVLGDGTILLPTWIGADDGAHVLEAVLSAPAKAWKKEKGTFTITGNELALIDSASDGRKTKPRAVARVKPGRYTIESMKEFDGEIIVGKAKHGLMASAVRLRPA